MGSERWYATREFFVVRDIPANQITVTEGTLLIMDPNAAFDDCNTSWRCAARALKLYAEQDGNVVFNLAVPKPSFQQTYGPDTNRPQKVSRCAGGFTDFHTALHPSECGESLQEPSQSVFLFGNTSDHAH